MYEYTDTGCFKGELLKQPPLPRDNPEVAAALEGMSSPRRRWLHYGCAVEELGRFGMMNPNYSDLKESTFVWHIYDQLTQPQPIENNDGVGAEGQDDEGRDLFAPRFVVAALVDGQIENGIGRCLEEYFGFRLLAPMFSNVLDHYGEGSRIGLWGVCTTNYLKGDGQDERWIT